MDKQTQKMVEWCEKNIKHKEFPIAPYDPADEEFFDPIEEYGIPYRGEF